MPTVYQRLTRYKESHPGTEVSKTRMKKISGIIKFIYDKNKNNQPLKWVESQEGENLYQVRHYPISFTNIIDTIIKGVLEKPTPPTEAKLTIETAPAPVPKKERKKIHVKSIPKPVFSTRNMK